MPDAKPLTKVEVERFMSIRETTIDLGAINVLIGANGTGKSNFLSLFDMVGSLRDQRLSLWAAQRGGADRVMFNGTKQSPTMRLRLEFTESQGYEAELAAATDGSLYFEREFVWGTGIGYEQPFNVLMQPGGTESKLPQEVAGHLGGVAAWTMACLSGWRRYHFHDTSSGAGVKHPQPIADNRELNRDGSNLAPFLHALRQNDLVRYERIRDTIRTVTPFFDDFVLEAEALNRSTIRLGWRHTDSEMFADATMLSDGTLRFMCLATVLLQPNPPKVVLIDEPELGLHPYAIHQLAELFHAASTRSQLVVATQSVTLLDQVRLDDVIVAERSGGASVLRRVDPKGLQHWLDDYSLGELWTKNLIGARPRHA
ncbi:MAG: AAA family ATPase [Acidimicrobiia bacterium]|nr:AAA family ATPase [Acidimicrobiia bacterium]